MSEWIEVKKEEEKKEKVNIWDPAASGQSIQGIFIDKEEEVGQYKSNMYTLRQENNEEIKIWGSTVLDSLMEKVPFGSEARITFNGTQPSKNGRNPWKDYKVEFRELD